MFLQEYRRKRDFKKSAEPSGYRPRTTADLQFVIQKRAASHLHYDFRLEMGGTLKSWAVPKGMPFSKGEKRLAVQVEDHPVSYAGFEGTIPKGQYGGGTVMLWDTGTYAPLSGPSLRAWEAGKMHFRLSGQKLHGEWYLVARRPKASPIRRNPEDVGCAQFDLGRATCHHQWWNGNVTGWVNGIADAIPNYYLFQVEDNGVPAFAFGMSLRHPHEGTELGSPSRHGQGRHQPAVGRCVRLGSSREGGTIPGSNLPKS